MMQRLNGTRPLEKYEIASGSTIVSGNLVALNAEGKAVPAADTAGLRVIGIAESARDGMVEVEDGVFSFVNDTTHALTRADRGKVAYVKDKDTVASTGTNLIPAGIVVDVHGGEVYLDVTASALAVAAAQAAAAALTAAASAPAANAEG